MAWNHSTLTLSLGWNANLESPNADFDRASSMNWPPGDVAYDKSDPADGPGYTLFMAHAPDTTAALHTPEPWDRDTCATAQYGGDDNAPLHANITAGRGLCFRPTDNNFYILIKVVEQDSQQITLDVTSWRR